MFDLRYNSQFLLQAVITIIRPRVSKNLVTPLMAGLFSVR